MDRIKFNKLIRKMIRRGGTVKDEVKNNKIVTIWTYQNIIAIWDQGPHKVTIDGKPGTINEINEALKQLDKKERYKMRNLENVFSETPEKPEKKQSVEVNPHDIKNNIMQELEHVHDEVFERIRVLEKKYSMLLEIMNMD